MARKPLPGTYVPSDRESIANRSRIDRESIANRTRFERDSGRDESLAAEDSFPSPLCFSVS
ncbi:hypothetical protein [Rhodopirellula europaea]|uniref:hypothetical protein n=1 Tax=Rhodopirellula europaea TaxID=1263866 RepID=UPI00118177A6|nr:hypothetical protein [Rhodopirellula europaea]